MKRIHSSVKVAEVIGRHPETVEVFLEHGCPDMRSGFFHMMAQITTVRAAAWIHGIPLEKLIEELNNVSASP